MPVGSILGHFKSNSESLCSSAVVLPCDNPLIKTLRTQMDTRKMIKILIADFILCLFSQNSNFKTAWINPREQTLKWLSRGHLNITVVLNTADQTVQLTGRISIKRTCNCKFQNFRHSNKNCLLRHFILRSGKRKEQVLCN